MKPFLILLLSSLTLWATPNPFYFSSAGSGSMSGADSSDCQQVSWVNTSGNWGSGAGQIANGTTMYLIGDCAAMNIYGNNITLLLGGGGFTTSDYSIINVAGGVSGLTIDGQNPTYSTSFGYIRCNANGSALANQAAPTGIACGSGVTGISVKNIIIYNLYVHTSLSDDQPGADTQFGIHCNGFSGSNFFGGIYFSNVGTAIYDTGNDFSTVTNCQFYNCNHGWYPSSLAGNTSNWLFNSTFGSCSNWDTTDNTFHNDSVIWGSSTGLIAEWRMIGNAFNGDLGYNSTAFVFWFANPPSYGLVARNFFCNIPGRTINSGLVVMNGQNMAVLNNTWVCGGLNTALTVTANGPIIGNNLIVNSANFVNIVGAFTSADFFNNIYANFTSVAGSTPWSFSSPSSYYSTLASWDAVTGGTAEQYIPSTLTLLNTNTGALVSGSAAISAGNIAAITDGVTGWPTGGPIDVGAFAFQNTSLTLIGSPSGLTLTGGAGGITLTH